MHNGDRETNTQVHTYIQLPIHNTYICTITFTKAGMHLFILVTITVHTHQLPW